MKIAVRVSKTAAALALVLPVAAFSQMTGTSHPDDKPIVNSPEVAQPVYVAPQPVALSADPSAPAPSLKPHPGIPMDAAPAPAYTAAPASSSASAYEAAAPRYTEETAPLHKFDPDANIVTSIPGPANQLPVGTLVKARLLEGVSTRRTVSGTLFTAQITEPVLRDGRVLLPGGSTISGMITDIHSGRRISGPSSIHLRTISVTLPDGTQYHLHGQVVDTSMYKEVKVDNEGTIKGKDHAAKAAATMGLATGAGAAAGAVIAGVPGALVGAAAGAGVSTIVWLKQDRQADLPANTRVTFSLTEPITFDARVGSQISGQ
jgi:hypothetical protein